MARYEISNAESGADMGIWEAESAEDAIRAMHIAAGYPDGIVPPEIEGGEDLVAREVPSVADEKAIRDLARQDRAGGVDDSYARTHDAEDTIRRWRDSARSAGDTECVALIERVGVRAAARIYVEARTDVEAE